MDSTYLALILFFIVAVLYSSVGHAGASGYLAIMALLSFAPDTIKPISLTLNIVVAAIASFNFIRKGFFDQRLFLIVVSASIPFSFVGGYMQLAPELFKLIAGGFLILSAGMIVFKTSLNSLHKDVNSSMPMLHGIIIGSVIGLFSGLIGVGGGIFLSPIILLMGWASVKQTSGIAALFILLNSISALSGHIAAYRYIDTDIYLWVIAVVLGGTIGSKLGTSRIDNRIILSLLVIVLLTAGVKFLFF